MNPVLERNEVVHGDENPKNIVLSTSPCTPEQFMKWVGEDAFDMEK